VLVRNVTRNVSTVLGSERLVRFFGVRLRMVALIVAVGLGSGAIGAAYLRALQLASEVLGPGAWTGGAHIAVLAAVGALITVLVRTLGRPADVELLVGNIHVQGMTDDRVGPDGRLRSLIPISLLSVGAGGTLGPEAPIVTTTGTVARRSARRAQLEPHDVRTLTITGMAAGFSVLFGAPLGAAIFALEIPHRRGLEYYEALVPAAIGALCGFAVSTVAGGHGLEPIWRLPVIDSIDGIDLAWAVLAGVLGAAIGVLFTVVVTVLHRLADVVPAAPRPMLGGILLGLLALVSPYALTNGEFQIETMLDHPPAVRVLIVAGLAKLLGAAIALVTGWRGGFIIPLFFSGFVLGWAVSGWLPIDHQWVFITGTMVAANVAVTKTPFGSALVVTEMTGYTLLPTSIVSSLTSLILTSPVGLLKNQRQRFDAYTTTTGKAAP
jgi:H+/Cl- antiporter ClcA